MLEFIPIFHRKLLSGSQNSNLHIANPRCKVLIILKNYGPIPMSLVASKLYMSKPHMTALINKMIVKKLVERQPDSKDRRIIKIKITQYGITDLEKSKKLAKDIIRKNLSGLSNEDINQLYRSIENTQKIMDKLEEKK